VTSSEHLFQFRVPRKRSTTWLAWSTNAMEETVTCQHPGLGDRRRSATATVAVQHLLGAELPLQSRTHPDHRGLLQARGTFLGGTTRWTLEAIIPLPLNRLGHGTHEGSAPGEKFLPSFSSLSPCLRLHLFTQKNSNQRQQASSVLCCLLTQGSRVCRPTVVASELSPEEEAKIQAQSSRCGSVSCQFRPIFTSLLLGCAPKNFIARDRIIRRAHAMFGS
jgi:hypothetical protein